MPRPIVVQVKPEEQVDLGDLSGLDHVLQICLNLLCFMLLLEVAEQKRDHPCLSLTIEDLQVEYGVQVKKDEHIA